MCQRYFLALCLIFGLVINPIALYGKPLSTIRRRADVKSAVIDGINIYVNQLKDTCFGKAVSLGDPAKFSSSLEKSVNHYYVGDEGKKKIKELSPNAQSFHYTYKLIGMTADFVFPFDPANLEPFESSALKDGYKNRQTMMHEVTHHIEWLNGVKESSKTLLGKDNPNSERNTNYQDFVINALINWRKTEEAIKNKKENLPNALNVWKTLEENLTALEKGSGAGGNPHDANLEEMTGFNVKFEAIKKQYLSGNCGEDFKTFVALADLLPKIEPNLELYRDSNPLGGGQTIELDEGEQLNVSATAVNNAVDVELKPELKAQFYWNAIGLETQKNKTFHFTAQKAGDSYTVNVDLRVPFNNKEYSIARGDFNIVTKAKEDTANAGKTKITAPKEVLATEIFDTKAIVPANLQSKITRTEWSPNSCAEQPGTLNPKLQFRNPYSGKVQENQVLLNLFDAQNNRLDSVSMPVTVKPVVFGGSAADIWEGGSHPGGVNLKRKEATRKRMDNGKEIDSARVNAAVEVKWDGFAHPQSLEEIQKELLKRKGSDPNKTISPITVAGWKGFILETNGVRQDFNGSGFVDAGYPSAMASGLGYVVKGCISFEFSYYAGGSGVMLGEGTGFGKSENAWWNDTPFLLSQSRVAANEAKSILSGLTISPDGTISKTPYKGPKLDGSDLPSVKLTVSPDNKKLKKGDIVSVQAVIENEENAEKPLQFTWTGEYTGSGQNVKFTADKAGKQTLTVMVSGVGAASVEFEVAAVKAEITQVSPTVQKITAGTPVSFSARLLSGDSEINGNYVYRWQPQPEAKFEPAEGAGKQTKAVFTQEGRTRVWVQILERKGEVLQTVAESQPIEIEVVAPIKNTPIKTDTTGNEIISKAKLSTAKLAEAKEIIKKGRLDEAIVLLDDAIKLNPKNTEAVTLAKKWKKERTTITAQLAKVRILIDQQKFLEASNEMIVAKNLHNLYPPVLEIEKELNDKWGKHDSGLNLAVGEVRLANEARNFKKALELAREIRAKYRLMSGTEQTLKNYEDWATTHEAEKNRQRAILLQGEAKFNAYDYEGAIKDFDVMWGNNHYEYWSIYEPEPKKYGDLRNEAFTRLKRINELMPLVGQVVDNPNFNKTMIQTALKNVDEVLQLQPTNAKAREYKTTLTERLGRGEKGMQYEQAIKKGNEYSDAQNYGEAIKEYDKAIKSDGKSAEAYRLRGRAKRANGDLKGALKDFDKSIEINPTNSKTFVGRGLVREKLPDIDGALSDYSRAIELDPNYTAAYSNRGGLRIDINDFQGAIADFDKVISLDPKNTSAYINRGVAKTRLENYNEALKDYNKAIELDSTISLTYNNRGYTKEKLNDLKGALSDYEKAVALDPNSETAQSRLAKLKEKMQGNQVAVKPSPTPLPTPTAKPTPKPTPTNVPVGKEVEIFNNMNIYGVQNKPTALTKFTITKPHVITYIFTYHWNNASGNRTVGFIGIYNEKGERFGPWQAKGTAGQGGVPNANWEISPNIIIPAGTYTIVVSQEETWSQNSQSGGRGMAIVKGYPTSGGTTQTPTITPTPTPKNTPTTPKQGAIVVAVIQNRSSESTHIFAEGDTFGPQNKIAPGASKEVSVRMTADGRIKFFAGRNGQIITSKIWTGDPSDMNRYPKVIFDGSQLIITTGLR